MCLLSTDIEVWRERCTTGLRSPRHQPWLLSSRYFSERMRSASHQSGCRLTAGAREQVGPRVGPTVSMRGDSLQRGTVFTCVERPGDIFHSHNGAACTLGSENGIKPVASTGLVAAHFTP